jgi:ferrous-iron efflux pump FieF
MTVAAPSPGEHTTKLLKRATFAAVSVSLVLVAVKFFAWVTTGSVSVFASLLDSLMDTAASLINLFAVNYSLKPADEEHRFGHGKAEALAGLGQSLFIALSAAFLLFHAVDRFMHPRQVENLGDAIGVIIFAVVLTLALVLFQRHVVKQTGSTAVRADSLHYLTDLVTNIATLAALVLMANGILRADSVFGLCIGVYIFVSAGRVGWSAVRILMDEELPREERNAILDSVSAIDGVLAVQRLRTWRSGQQRIVDIEIVFEGSRTLHDIHSNSERVAEKLAADIPFADVSIRPVPGKP